MLIDQRNPHKKKESDIYLKKQPRNTRFRFFTLLLFSLTDKTDGQIIYRVNAEICTEINRPLSKLVAVKIAFPPNRR